MRGAEDGRERARGDGATGSLARAHAGPAVGDASARRRGALRGCLQGLPRGVVRDGGVGLEADPACDGATGGDSRGLERALGRQDVAPSVDGRERFPVWDVTGRIRERKGVRGWGEGGEIASASIDDSRPCPREGERRATHLSTISKRRGGIWRASSPSLASSTSRRVMFSISIVPPARDVGRDATGGESLARSDRDEMKRRGCRARSTPYRRECAGVPARSAARSLVADRSGASMRCVPPVTQRYAVRDGGNARVYRSREVRLFKLSVRKS